MDVHGLRTLTFSIEILQTTHFGINTQKYHTQKYQTKTNFGSKQSSILTIETVTRVTRCFLNLLLLLFLLLSQLFHYVVG